MLSLPENTLAAIGRMVVASTELEHVLAWIGADRGGGDAAAVFAQPGYALIAARGSVEFAPAGFRERFITAVEAAGIELALSQATLRRLWRDDTLAGPVAFDDLAGRLLSSRDDLQELIEAQLGVIG